MNGDNEKKATHHGEKESLSTALSQLFSLSALNHAFAGTLAGSISMTVFYPIDQIRLKSQIEDKPTQEIVRDELFNASKGDLMKLYNGLGPLLVSLACSNFVYFYCNNALKLLVRWRGRKLNVPLNLIIAAVAGCVNVLLTNPLWVVNTRVRAQKDGSPSMLKVFASMIREEGIQSLWNGTASSLLLVSNPTIQFVAYDTLKKLWEKKVKRNLYAIEYFLLAAIAKSIATLLTYPLQVAQSQIRAQKRDRSQQRVATKIDTEESDSNENTKVAKSKAYKNTMDCLIRLLKKEGIKRGWFKGFSVKFTQTVLMSAFHFLFYEKILGIIYVLLRIRQ